MVVGLNFGGGTRALYTNRCYETVNIYTSGFLFFFGLLLHKVRVYPSTSTMPTSATTIKLSPKGLKVYRRNTLFIHTAMG